jgi:hypothetical protein
MRPLRTASLVLMAASVVAVPQVAAPSDSATATLGVSVLVASRTSLRVSTQILGFDVTAPGEPAMAFVDVVASSRTREGGEVVLSIEPVRGRWATSDGDGDGDRDTLTFVGEGAGLSAGWLSVHSPAVAGRWIGSGTRSGRLSFALRARRAGAYTIPVRFVLSTP